MKITNIKIRSWRNFENIEISIPREAKLIGLIGENGLGKTNLLNLISASSVILGLSPGNSNNRPNPFSEIHNIEITIFLDRNIESHCPMYIELTDNHPHKQGFVWDGTITLKSIKESAPAQLVQTLHANGNSTPRQQTYWASQIVQNLKTEQNLHYMLIDADRSFPAPTINDNVILQAERSNPDLIQTKKSESYQSSANQYNFWIKSIIGKERKYSSEFASLSREAQRNNQAQPQFRDIFSRYNEMLGEMLPHLSFFGTDNGGKTINFKSNESIVQFHHLSGGEKEIAYILGQIFRYELQNGLLLLDEPELHLNPDLIRKWVSYLRNTIQTGQLWISTHAIEAAEVTSNDYTFLLSKSPETGKVDTIRPLSSSNAISELFANIGMPAYSISNKKFIFIEGPSSGEQKELFYKLTNYDTYRFVEAEGCKQVLARKEALEFFSNAENISLDISAIIDRDFKSDEHIQEIQSSDSSFVLPVHEIENYFLHPETLNAITVSSINLENIKGHIKSISSRFAGQWIIERASYKYHTSPITRPMKQYASQISWGAINNDQDTFKSTIRTYISELFNEQTDFNTNLESAITEFQTMYSSEGLWKFCMGKQTLNTIPSLLGFTNTQVVKDAIFDKWKEDESLRPQELIALIDFLS